MWIIFLLLFTSSALAAAAPQSKTDLPSKGYAKGKYESPAPIDVPADNSMKTSVYLNISNQTNPTVCYNYEVQSSTDGLTWRREEKSSRCGGPSVQRDGTPITYSSYDMGNRVSGKKLKTILEITSQNGFTTDSKIVTK